MNGRVAKKIAKELSSLALDEKYDLDEKTYKRVYRRTKRMHNKVESPPLVIQLGKRHKGESLEDFRKRRRKINKRKRCNEEG